MTKDVNLVGLDYFKPSGKYYSSGYFEAPEGALLDEVCQMVKKRMQARELPGLAGGHSLFDVVVTYKGVPALISAATQPREPEPKACPACKGEPESGFIEMDNNGPIVPCRTCNSDPESCADVPSLRHCEAANRETATQPPQATDAQRQAALDDLDLLEEIGWFPEQDESGLAKRFERIRTAIQSPAVPREVQKALATYFPFDHLEHEEQQSVFEFMEQSGLALMLDTEKGSAEEYEYGQYVWRLTGKALALLQQKGGDQ